MHGRQRAQARGWSARTTRCSRCRLRRAVAARRHECCWTCRVWLRQLGPRRRVGRRVACAVRRWRHATAGSIETAWRDECGARRGHPRARSPSAAGYMSSCCVCAVSCVSVVFEQRTVIHGPWQPIWRVLARNGEGQILTTHGPAIPYKNTHRSEVAARASVWRGWSLGTVTTRSASTNQR